MSAETLLRPDYYSKTEVMLHQHHVGFVVAVFISFLIGATIDVWRQASSVVNSSLNGIKTYGQYFKTYASVQATKTFAALLVILFWFYHPTTGQSVVGLVWPGGNPPQWADSVLVVTPATAGMFGLFCDMAEDWAIIYLRKVPGLGQFFPEPVPPTSVPKL